MPENITGTTGFTGGAIQKPSSKDSGSTVFNTLEEFMERLAAHTHDGVDSENISRTVSKTPYFTVGSLGTTGGDQGIVSIDDTIFSNTYVDVSVVLETLQPGTNNHVTYSFWYFSTAEGTSGGWIQFHPDIDWDGARLRIYTNIIETIRAAGSTSAKIMVQAY